MEQATTRGKLYQTGKAKAQSLAARVGMTKQQRNQRPLKDNDKRTTSIFKGVLAATTLLGAGAMMEKAAFADTQAATVTSAMQSEALPDVRLVNLTSTSLTSDDVSTSEQGSEAISLVRPIVAQSVRRLLRIPFPPQIAPLRRRMNLF